MTIIMENIQPAQAQVHVMIIGVGKYPHLPGGGSTPAKRTLGLGQLTSPPVSARNFCQWFLDRYHNPDRSLGSIEMFLSEAQPTPFDLPLGAGHIEVASARMENIDSAFYQWKDRCKSHPDNLLVFYFCGHGVQIGASNILLLEDYGENYDAPFRGAIHFNRMWKGLSGVVAGHKCFFVDACSNVPWEGQDIEDTEANGFLSITNDYRYWDRLTVIRAAVDGRSAYGRKKLVSRFTRALMECLNGRGAIYNRDNNRWEITNQSLTNPLSIIMDEINDEEKGKAQVHSPDHNPGVVTLQVQEGVPDVPVVIEFRPADVIEDALLKLVSVNNRDWELSYPNPAGNTRTIGSNWVVGRVPTGIYKLGARFQNRPYRAIEEYFIGVDPPGPAPSSGPIILEVLP